MNSSASARASFPLPTLVAVAAAVAVSIAALIYLSRSTPATTPNPAASQVEKAYVKNLQLSDVSMQATENFMNQQVVEVQGKIANQGPKPLRSIDVYCLFLNVEGKEVRRERFSIVPSSGNTLNSGEVRPFRLPFDSVPEGWNQALPRMVIARIAFAN